MVYSVGLGLILDTLGLHKGAEVLEKRERGGNLFGFCGVCGGNLRASALTNESGFSGLGFVGLWVRSVFCLIFGQLGFYILSNLLCASVFTP